MLIFVYNMFSPPDEMGILLYKFGALFIEGLRVSRHRTSHSFLIQQRQSPSSDEWEMISREKRSTRRIINIRPRLGDNYQFIHTRRGV